MNTNHKGDLIFKEVDFDPFAGSETVIPTTEPQREIWTNVQIGGQPANCSYNESVSLLLNGPFNFEVFKKAVDAVFVRHDALRSTFSNDGLTLKIAQTLSIDVPLLDFTDSDDISQRQKIKEVLDEEAEQQFDLVSGPLARIKVLRLGNEKHQLVLSFHHIICDGWSLGIIMQDLGNFYSALLLGKMPESEPAVSFTDYAIEQENYQLTEENHITEEFWINKFKSDLPSFELPVDKTRPAERTFKANRVDVEVPSEIVERLKKAGAKQGTSFVATLVSAFEIFLYRITGNEDIVLGLPAAGQSVEGNQYLVGHCVNLLPLRTSINPSSSFNEYLRKRKPEILDAYDHQRYTFGSLIKKLNIPRDPSRIPLVPVAFNVDIGITNGVNFENCSYFFSTNPRHYENFEVFINAAGNGNQLTLECTHNTDLFDPVVMRTRMQEFVVMLKGIVANPDSSIAFLPVLTDNEHSKLFQEWNSNVIPFDKHKTIQRFFEEKAIEQPGAIALCCGNDRISYKELNERANKLAHHLISMGSGPDILIGVCMERNAELIISMMAILKSGSAYVPIDPNYPADRISYIMQDAKASLIVTDSNFEELLSKSETPVLFIDKEKSVINSCPVVDTATSVVSSNLAYVIYTSGSTGKPKGVAIEHRNVAGLFAWASTVYSKEEMDGVLASTSVCFDLSVFEIFNTLAQGGRIILVKDALALTNIQPDLNVRLINTVPSAASELLKIDKGIPTSVITINLAGEPLPTILVNKLYELPHIKKVYDLYGPSEDTTYSTFTLRIPGERATIGKILPNSTLYLLDKNLQPVPIGIAGEIYIGGEKLARGYLYRPDLTSERFIPNPFSTLPGSRLYRTGDLAKFYCDGNIEFLGRIDNQVKIRGFRIELGEIESRLQKYPGITEQIVVAREDQPGEKKVVAYVVLKGDASKDISTIRSFLKEELPEYMVPSIFIFLDALPLTPNGKIDRKSLPSPDISTQVSNKTFEEPQTPVEDALVNIWCNVLGLDKVGRKDNFFELGGHSLLGVRMFNEVEKQLGIKMQLGMLFRFPTIEELAGAISKEPSDKPWSCLVPLQPNGSRTPLFCIHMHNGNINRWRVLIKHLGNDQPIYAIQPKGLDYKQEPHTTIEEMASYYIDVMKKVQPAGPYNLLGLCFSGMVVYEMASILESQGEKVAFLGMVNNYAPPENPTIYKVKNELNKFMKMEIGDKFNYAIEKNMNLGKKLFVKAKKLLPGEKDALIPEIQIDEHVKDDSHDLRTIHSLALLNYHPNHIYHGSLAIFRTSDPIEPFYNEHLGWDRLIKGKIETTVIDGCNNDTIITDEPYNIILSLKLKEYLDKLIPENAGRSKNGGIMPGGMFSAAIL